MTAVTELAGQHTVAYRVYKEARKSVIMALSLLLFLGGGLAVFVMKMPALQPEEREAFRYFPPRSVHHLVAQRDVLLNYAAVNPVSVLSGLCLSYVLMQTFAIPGTLTLSILSGALYGVRRGWLLVAAVSTVGACSCYCLSWLLGNRLAHAVWPGQLERYGAEVAARRRDMLNYIVFLRVTPILPNTFINVASPIVGVPLMPFTLGTLLGCLPNNFVAVNAGSRLGELQSLRDLYDPKMLGIGELWPNTGGVGVGLIALLPIFLKHRAQRRQRREAAALCKAD
ncbi:hypothetical protein N2152v2_004899 [Parachlorella kessleri]